jgi:hypothetical protein
MAADRRLRRPRVRRATGSSKCRWEGGAAYVFQFVALNLFAAWFLARQADLGAGLRVALGLAIVWSVASLAALLDGRRWAPVLEGVRASTLAVLAMLFFRL